MISAQTSHHLKPILFSFIGIMALLQVIVAVIATFSLQRCWITTKKNTPSSTR